MRQILRKAANSMQLRRHTEIMKEIMGRSLGL